LYLRQYKSLLLVLAGVMALIVASPVLQKVLVYPQTEYFTELWLLGPEHTANNYPYNITSNNKYNIFLGVANHLGFDAHYILEVKFRNQTQSAPNIFNRTHSSLESLYSMDLFVAENETWEMPLTFSVDYSFEKRPPIYETVSFIAPDGKETYYLVPVVTEQVNFNNLRLNDATVSLQGLYSEFDNQTDIFFGNLVFELWIYDSLTSGYVYHERYVDLKLSMTKKSE